MKKRFSVLIFVLISILIFSQKTSINGEYKISCANKYQILDINKNVIYMSLFKDNIYINGKIIKEGKVYKMYFSSVEPSVNREYGKLDTLNISKRVPIGIIKQNKNGLELKWKGLYNSKTKTRGFVKDFVLVEDNYNHGMTILLKKCN